MILIDGYVSGDTPSRSSIRRRSKKSATRPLGAKTALLLKVEEIGTRLPDALAWVITTSDSFQIRKDHYGSHCIIHYVEKLMMNLFCSWLHAFQASRTIRIRYSLTRMRTALLPLQSHKVRKNVGVVYYREGLDEMTDMHSVYDA